MPGSVRLQEQKWRHVAVICQSTVAQLTSRFFAPLMRKEIILKAMQFEVSSFLSLLVNCYQKTKNYQNLIEQPKSKRKYVYD